MTPAPQTLLSPAVLRELDALRRRIARRVASQGHGLQVAPRRGGQAEFIEHRSYGSGDDLRKVDWAAYARSGEPVVKVFRSEEDCMTRLLVDTSASIGYGTPSKLRAAAELAAAMGYLSLCENEPTQLILASGEGTRILPTFRGRRQLLRLLHPLQTMRAEGKTGVCLALDELLKRRQRSGNLLIFSDFFDDGDLLRALAPACHLGHDVVLVQLFSQEEVQPTLTGNCHLVDSESNEGIDIRADVATLAAYHQALRAHVERLSHWAKRHGAGYVKVVGKAIIGQQVRQILRRSVEA